MERYLRANAALWDRWTELHAGSAAYDIAGFKAGRTTLRPLEIAELGDVAGKSLLHVQSHFGLDTLSWARRGAEVVGVDFSARVVALARSLAREVGLAARFVRSDVYDLPAALTGAFDLVFTSYGVLYWLPDLPRWAAVVAHFLKPGGVFYLAEHHPLAAVFDPDEAAELRPGAPYFGTAEPEHVESFGSYAEPSATSLGDQYGWRHTLGEVVSAVAAAGLRIEHLHEFPYTDFPRWPRLERGDDG